MKQKVQVKTCRIGRFEKKTKLYRQNKIFKTDAIKFYREIGVEAIEIKVPSSIKEVEKFFKEKMEQ